MKILQVIKLNGLTGVAVVALIAGCSSMSGNLATNDKLTVELIDSRNAKITRANVQEDATGLKVNGSLKNKLPRSLHQRRNEIPGHLHIEVLDSSGDLLARSITSYHRRHYKSNTSNFSEILQIPPGKAAKVRVIHHGANADYIDRVNPLPATEINVAAGEELYQQYCARCHGESGEGDGIAGKILDRQPINVAVFSKKSYASDSYLFWMIFEGGDVLRSEMPTFGEMVKDDEIWKIITYLRQL